MILFDWGGTLADVAGQTESWQRGARDAGRQLAGTDGVGAVGGLVEGILSAEGRAAADPSHREADLGEVLSRWAGSLPRPPGPEAIAAAAEALGTAWVGSLAPLPGALEAVGCLRDRGYRMGLVSNCCVPPAYCRQELTRQGFAELLDFALFSSAVGYRKPSPVIYRQALQQAQPDGVPDDLSGVLFVGDSPALDVIVPATMGMKTALVRRPPGVWPAEDYARAKPDLTLDTVAELPVRLRELEAR